MMLALAVAPVWAQAQYRDAKTGVAVRWLAPNYQIPLENGWNREDFSSGLEFEYLRHLNRFLNISVPIRITKAYLPSDLNGGSKQDGTMSADLLLHLKLLNKQARVYPHVFGGISAVSEFNQDIYTAIPVGLGLNFLLGPDTYLSTQASYRISDADNRDHLQLGAGLLFLLGATNRDQAPAKPSDRDGDGIADANDLCPDQPGKLELNGCPDTDGDGIADGSDKCPTVAGSRELMGCPDRDRDGIADINDECPDEPGTAATKGCPVRDRDRDGIADTEDACPDVAGMRSAKGCPDRDGDGIADDADKCPDAVGPLSTQGCPDRDGDGVVDADDRCPNNPGPAANLGCPEITKEDRETLTLALQAVQFETGNAVLKQESYAILDKVVDILNRYSDYRCQINGHTDSIGEAAANQTLSERRAKACYDYLVSKGISANRLAHAGFGESQPIADNRFMDGRAKNRRVEFNLFIQ